MARSKKPDPEDESGFLQKLTRFWVTLFVILLILYVASFFIVRTDGFRYMITEKISERTGWTITIARTWLNPDGSIVFSDIATEGFHRNGAIGMHMDELQLSFSLIGALTPRRPFVSGLKLSQATLAYDFRANPDPVLPYEGDAWRLARWLDVARTPPREQTPAQLLGGERNVRLDKVDILWWNPDTGVLMQSLQGIRLRAGRARLLESEVLLREISADAVFSEGVTQVHVTRRTLLLDGQEIVP